MTSNVVVFLLPAVLLFAVVLFAAWVRSPSVRGSVGEFVVDRALRSLDASEYRIYADLILPSLDGTTQIDHIVVSRFGVFVIETKNFGGLIVGSPRSAQWTQRRGRRSYPFQNPLRQNHRHVKAVETALGVSQREIIPLLVFAGECRLHPNIANCVTSVATLASTISSCTVPMFSAARRDELCQRLERARLDEQPGVRRAHAAALREKHRSGH